jgi:selenocysteine lyase/cysteine desulfurase
VGADPQDVVLGPNATSLLNAVVLSGTHTSPHQSRHGDAGDGDGERTGSGLGGGVAVAQHPLFALQRGDHVLLLDTAYGGVKKLCAEACRRAGAALDVVPLPLPLPGSAALETSATADAAAAAAAAASCVEAIACRVRATPSGRAALVVLDHTTSNTALTLPVAAMAAAAKAAGARCVLVDGAHGVWAQVQARHSREQLPLRAVFEEHAPTAKGLLLTQI